jgi:hypothetical protein
MTTNDRVRILQTLTTRNEAGRHFTERYSPAVLSGLESEGLIAIDRPVHQPSGIPYDQSCWTVEVTPKGAFFVNDYWSH